MRRFWSLYLYLPSLMTLPMTLFNNEQDYGSISYRLDYRPKSYNMWQIVYMQVFPFSLILNTWRRKVKVKHICTMNKLFHSGVFYFVLYPSSVSNMFHVVISYVATPVFVWMNKPTKLDKNWCLHHSLHFGFHVWPLGVNLLYFGKERREIIV